METHELRNLINELCNLAVLRNEINTRRHRARFRKNYYAHALRVVEAHNGTSSELRYFDRHNVNCKHQAKIDSLRSNMAWLVKKHPKPTKWKTMGLYKIRSLILQGQGEYAMAKHETMEFTIKHRERVKYITAELNCVISYDNGSIRAISFIGRHADTVLYRKDIIANAEQYELNKAVEAMVEE